MTKRNSLFLSTSLSTLFSMCLPFAVDAVEVTDIKEVIGNIEANKVETNTDIIQIDNNVVINWGKFDINRNETVRFRQPSSNSIALNRVISNNASYIDGQLIANGKIIIINQNGIMFGNNARIDVNGLIASTIDIDNEKFLKNPGNLKFDKPGNIDATIINNGLITAKEAGLVGLIAPNVINNGAIVANSGQIVLASGDNFTVDMYGDKLVEVSVSDKLKSQLISNNGLIEADGGKVIITAAAGKEIVNNLIEINGEIKAASIAEKNGEILIYAEGSNAVAKNISENKGIKKGESNVHIYGKLDVSGQNPGEHGGKIVVTGDNVALLDGAFIDARGHSGLSGTTKNQEKSAPRTGAAGGDIQIGGNYLGQGDTPSSLNLYVDPGVLVLNDAINNGDAGRTIFWSDNTTEFYGNVYARALGGKKPNRETWNALKGGKSGDGGFVETSGHRHLDAYGNVDITASNGETGTYLLDPENIAIYGNFDPKFASTDGSITLAPNLKLWLDGSNSSSITFSYQDLSTTVTGTAGQNTLTIGSVGELVAGAKIRLNNASSGDTYTIQSISGSTLTLTTNLTENYSGASAFAGYVSAWGDNSGNSYNATQSNSSFRPLWLNDQQNNKAVLKFDGTNDGFDVYLDFLAGVSHTSFISANTINYSDLYGATDRDSGNNSLHVGFKDSFNYRENFWSNDFQPVISGSFIKGSFNTLTYVWPQGSKKKVYANSKLEGQQSSINAGNIGIMAGGGKIAGNIVGHGYWGGSLAEIIMYDANLSSDNIMLLNQYQSAKWNIPLFPPGSGSTETARAMSSTGYSVFTTDYLSRLSNSVNISLLATSNITLDFKGASLTLANGKSFTLQANGNISSLSNGSILTNRTTVGGNINITAGNTLDITNISMRADNGGNIFLSAGTGAPITNLINFSGGVVSNKIYDSTTTGTFSVVPSATSPVTISGTASLKFSNKNVGNGKTVKPSGYIISGVPSTTYANYQYIAPSYTANITKSSLSVSGLTADNKVYDATTTGTISGTPVVSPLGSDVVSVAGTAVGTFNNKNVGTSKPVSLSGLTLSGTDASNYSIVVPSSLTANITQSSLSVSGLTTNNKVYDATTDATISGTPVVSPLGSDVVSVAGTAVGTFNNKNVGTSKPVSLSGLTLSGTDASNYSIVVPSSLTANITKSSLSVNGLTTNNKVYDATTDATISGTPVVSPLGSDVVSVAGTAVGTFNNKNVGTSKPVSLSGLTLSGTDASNYSIVVPSDLTANITKAFLTVKANNQSMVYGQEMPTFTYSYTGLVASDDFESFTGSLIANTTRVGQSSILKNTLEADGNYEIENYIPGTLTVSAPKNIIPNSVYTSINNVAANVPTNVFVSNNPNVNINIKNNNLFEYTEGANFDFIPTHHKKID